MSILRTIVILADVGVFGWLIWLGTVEGLSGDEWFFFLALLLLIVLNLYFIAPNKRGGDSWIGLFLKRKTLEEKQRIVDLETKHNNQNYGQNRK